MDAYKTQEAEEQEQEVLAKAGDQRLVALYVQTRESLTALPVPMKVKLNIHGKTKSKGARR